MPLKCAVSFGLASLTLPLSQMPDCSVGMVSVNSSADAFKDSYLAISQVGGWLFLTLIRFILGSWMSLGAI